MPPMGMMPGGSTTTGTQCGTTATSSSVTITVTTDDAVGTKTGYPGGYRLFTANGCPGYDWTSQSTPNKAYEQTKSVKVPVTPMIAKTPWATGIKNVDGTTNTNPSKGSIGIAINGVSLYGNADATNGDAFINEGKTFDKCNGHPQNAGDYHYHMEPVSGCVFKDTAGQHSPLFAVMYDGIPLYGQLGDNGVAPTDLDACGGHTDKTYPFYHYHLPKAQAFPYLVACLKGCIFSNQINGLTAVTVATCDKATTQYDYSTLKVVAASSGTSPAPTPTPSSGSNSRNVQGYLILSIIFSLLILFF